MANPAAETVDPPVLRVQLRGRDLACRASPTRSCAGAFAECDGLELTIESRALREGGNNGVVHRLAGPAGYGQLTLKRGMTRQPRPLALVQRRRSSSRRCAARARSSCSRPTDHSERARFLLTPAAARQAQGAAAERQGRAARRRGARARLRAPDAARAGRRRDQRRASASAGARRASRWGSADARAREAAEGAARPAQERPARPGLEARGPVQPRQPARVLRQPGGAAVARPATSTEGATQWVGQRHDAAGADARVRRHVAAAGRRSGRRRAQGDREGDRA